MKKTLLVSLCLVLSISLLASLAIAKNTQGRYANYERHRTLEDVTYQGDISQLQASAVQGTTWLASYTFDSGPVCVDEGWTSADITAQVADFWHVDDFVGMGGNYQGNTGVIDGSQSLWCGARADAGDTDLCGYVYLPGYGNSWNQAFCTKVCNQYGTNAAVVFDADWDSEPGYDATTLEITTCTGAVSDENWVVLAGGTFDWDGNLDDYTVNGDTTITVAIDDSLYVNSPVKVRLHFVSDGAWSDQDGLWDTDGAFVVDNLRIDGDNASLAVEDFETTSGNNVGDTSVEDWESCTPAGYGDFADMYNALTLVVEDPCQSNITCVWTFYTGSTADYGCGGFPAQTAVPYENLRGQYINNEIWSPLIPNVGTGVQYGLQFDVYRDLALNPLIFYVWHVRSWVAGCPSGWADRNFVYYGGQKDWIRPVQNFGDLVVAGASDIQVALGAVDMCPFWCGVYGTGACHSHAPLFDNVEVYRVDTAGPQWSVRDIDLFQDNFSEDGTITGTARIDEAIDILPSDNLNFVPGDSATVTVSDPDVGLGTDGSGWGAVYCYVSVDGPTASTLAGTPGVVTTDAFKYPYIGSSVDGFGRTWYQIRMDTCFTDGVDRTGAVPDKFAADLNDSLFVPGDTIYFVFGARNASGVWTYNTATTSYETFDEAAAVADEVTILPAGGYNAGGDILYVDGMNFRGAQPYFDTAFQQLGIFDEVDRYDIRGPSSGVANRPGSRVTDPFQQLVGVYRKIVWNTGDLNIGLIGDGSTTGEKSDDAGMLLAFLDNLALPGGVYFNGDNIAQEWPGWINSAIPLRDTYIQHTLVDGNHTDIPFPISPRVIGESGGAFDHVTGPDTLIAYGGCPLINDFDVIEPVLGTSAQEMYYDGGSPAADGAVLSQYTLNNNTVSVGVILSGFSFHFIRDDAASGGLDRSEHMRDVLTYLGNQVNEPTDVNPSLSKYSLSQNYPNPFNPTTTIDFTVKELTPVTVKIYNVRGQLVRTLANDRFAPGQVYQLTWDGRNDTGQSVSSGVYFYKMVSKNFTQTKKMVLLK